MRNNLSVHELVKKLVDTQGDQLSISTQTELLGISRSSVYYQPREINASTLAIQNRVDEIYTAEPYLGSRSIKAIINRERRARGEKEIGRRLMQSIMKRLGVVAIYPGPNLSRNGKDHPKFPYLLREVNINRPNQAWGTDITYIRLGKGFIYLTVIMDWHSRYILSWKVSTSLDAGFCIEAAKEALNQAIPEIINSDQGVQYTSQEWINLWQATTAKISMDGRRRFVDNIFVERFWRTLKYNEVYLKNYETVKEAIDGIGQFIEKYNNWKPHQSLDYKTPAEVYFGNELKTQEFTLNQAQFLY